MIRFHEVGRLLSTRSRLSHFSEADIVGPTAPESVRQWFGVDFPYRLRRRGENGAGSAEANCYRSRGDPRDAVCSRAKAACAAPRPPVVGLTRNDKSAHALLDGLRGQSYREGSTIAIDDRSSVSHYEELVEVAADLVQQALVVCRRHVPGERHRTAITCPEPQQVGNRLDDIHALSRGVGNSAFDLYFVQPSTDQKIQALLHVVGQAGRSLHLSRI